MPNAQVWLPILLQHIDTDFACLGDVWVEYLCQEVACSRFDFQRAQLMRELRALVVRLNKISNKTTK